MAFSSAAASLALPTAAWIERERGGGLGSEDGDQSRRRACIVSPYLLLQQSPPSQSLTRGLFAVFEMLLELGHPAPQALQPPLSACTSLIHLLAFTHLPNDVEKYKVLF